eukprot:2855648-Prymnesium_polylepis.1
MGPQHIQRDRRRRALAGNGTTMAHLIGPCVCHTRDGPSSRLADARDARPRPCVVAALKVNMSAGRIGGALIGLGGAAFVAMHISGINAEAAEKTEVQGSRLKKTLSNAGLYPEPEKNSRLKSRPSGDMAM